MGIELTGIVPPEKGVHMKALAILVIGSCLSVSAYAKGKTDKETLVKNMVSACKAELANDPALTDTTDGETVWKNIEDKEHGTVKLSKTCHSAHEKYEAKYHKEDAGEEHEHQ